MLVYLHWLMIVILKRFYWFEKWRRRKSYSWVLRIFAEGQIQIQRLQLSYNGYNPTASFCYLSEIFTSRNCSHIESTEITNERANTYYRYSIVKKRKFDRNEIFASSVLARWVIFPPPIVFSGIQGWRHVKILSFLETGKAPKDSSY